ncbi:carboxyl transferase domain-containing protein [Ruminococcus sp. Marseille-P6503]|uniref:carboxyl transferase domain-containing protein n=1 Tax=Ruminococcus sp. Marseille-P6503 TaxID=2364796 RepID=UPI000F54450B|nr:carboxyl transferase domain-containing protein [Ruminococcus sp. Marseille-P6503]
MSDSISTLAELQAMTAAPASARNRLAYLFDEGKYTELDPYAKSGCGLSGVVTAYGYVDGNPVYAFSQDISVNSGALSKVQADKIAKILDMAAATGVPVVGIYDSFGADLNDGFAAMSAYGELLMRVSNLSGVVPQIAVVAGTCAGTAAMLAESADFTVITKASELYTAPNSDIKNLAENAAANGTACIVAADDKTAVEAVKDILSKLPQNNLSPVPMYEFEAPASAFGNDAVSQAEAVFDAGSLIELYAGYGKASYTALGTLGGASVGIIATNKTDDKLTADDCSKIARFVRTCDAYALPVITFVDTEGFAADDETEAAGAVKSMAKLAHAYAEATTIKLAVITGKAYGPAYIALAGRGANADMTFALPHAVISPLNPEAAVEFLYHDKLKGAEDLAAKRNELAEKYAAEEACAAAAAQKNCLDNIVEGGDIRDILISSVEIMAGKRISRLPKKHSNIQI